MASNVKQKETAAPESKARSNGKGRRGRVAVARGVMVHFVRDPHFVGSVYGKYRVPQDHEVEGLRGRTLYVRAPSRYDIKPRQSWKADLALANGYLMATFADGAADAPPQRKPLYDKIVSDDQLIQVQMKDRDGKPVYRHASLGVLCYLDVEHGVLPLVSETDPAYVVFTKGAYAMVTTDAQFIELLAEMQVEGRVPDLTYLRTGKFTLRHIDFDQLNVGYEIEGTDGNRQWRLDEELSIEDLLDLTATLPTEEELEAKRSAYVEKLETELSEEKLRFYRGNPCTDRQVEMLREARNINIAKAKQAAAIVRKRLVHHQRSLATSLGMAEEQLARIIAAATSGVDAPAPASIAALTAGEDPESLTALELIKRWVDALRRCFETETLGGVSIHDYGQALFSSVFSVAGKKLPGQLDDDWVVVRTIFDGAGFPNECRLPLVRFIRVNFQGHNPELYNEPGEALESATETNDENAELIENWGAWLKNSRIRQELRHELARTGLKPEGLSAEEAAEQEMILGRLNIDEPTRGRILSKLRK